MSSKGWFNLETAAGTIPETQFFEGDSAFKALGLTRTQRLYGFAGWYVRSFGLWFLYISPPPFALRWAGLASANTNLSLTNDFGPLVVNFRLQLWYWTGPQRTRNRDALCWWLGLFCRCVCSPIPATPDFDPDFVFLSLVLYALGTIVSLIGTGFLIGVRLIFLLARKWTLTSRKTQSKQFSKQIKLVSGSPAAHNI